MTYERHETPYGMLNNKIIIKKIVEEGWNGLQNSLQTVPKKNKNLEKYISKNTYDNGK